MKHKHLMLWRCLHIYTFVDFRST